MIASQRSGTHLLREILNSNPNLAVVSEPFSRDENSPGNWYRFLKKLPSERSTPYDVNEATRLFDEYVAQLPTEIVAFPDIYGGAKQTPLSIGLDIKYNQIRSIDPLYIDLSALPFMIWQLFQRKARVIHLVRRNVLQVALSAIIANQRKVWQNYEHTQLTGKFNITIDELIDHMKWVKAEREAFESLSTSLRLVTIYYEDLIADLPFAEGGGAFRRGCRTMRAIADHMRVPNRFRYDGRIQKVINRPYAEVIQNYDEVKRAVNDSPFFQFVETI